MKEVWKGTSREPRIAFTDRYCLKTGSSLPSIRIAAGFCRQIHHQSIPYPLHNPPDRSRKDKTCDSHLGTLSKRQTRTAKMAPTMPLAPQAAYTPTSDAPRRDYGGVTKPRKTASTGGGRAWSEEEVRHRPPEPSVPPEPQLTQPRNNTSFRRASRRCLTSTSPRTSRRRSLPAASTTTS